MEIQILLQKPHKNQQKILNEARRFNVLKCGRQFGKTDLSKELTIQPILDGKRVGYWYPTYKDGDKTWRELVFILKDIIKYKDSQLKKLETITGGTLDMWSMDDPDSGRGFKYHRAIIDEAEKAKHFKEAWKQTIRATLFRYKGDAWFLSTPKFGKTYFKEIFNYKEKMSDWMSWRFTSYDNPFLDAAEIENAKQLDELTYRCEYLAEDVDLTNNPFLYAFSKDKHVCEAKFNPHSELYLSFDFNVDPITCIAAQMYDDTLFIVDEFLLKNSDIYELCDRIKGKYPNALMRVTGDATGQNRSAISKGNLNYYSIIQMKLGLNDLQMNQPTINPAVSDSRVLCNSLLQNYSIKISDKCEKLIEDCMYVEVDDKGDIKKDRTTEHRKADLLDTFRYLCNTYLSWFLDLRENNEVYTDDDN